MVKITKYEKQKDRSIKDAASRLKDDHEKKFEGAKQKQKDLAKFEREKLNYVYKRANERDQLVKDLHRSI